jgi:molybdopterin molybdotransferase
MKTFDEARSYVIDAVSSTTTETVPLDAALDLTAATDVVAPISLPPFDTAAVDGYAVRAADVAGATNSMPIRLRVVGEALPGMVCLARVEPGSAIRILTGAAIPGGATLVVPFESSNEAERDRREPTVLVLAPGPEGDGIRLAGSGISAGSLAVRQGTRLRPVHLALLASLGASTVRVHRRPRIALLSVGDQFVSSGEALGPAQVYEANEAALAGAVREAGGIPVPLGISADRIDAIGDRVRSAGPVDFIVVSGGVTHGAHDIVRDYLVESGRIGFWRVAMRPGRPTGFGWIGETPLISVPGNPGGALVVFDLLVRPAIRKLLGYTNLLRPEVDVVVHGSAANPDSRRCFLPARVELSPTGFVATLRAAGNRAGPGIALEPNAFVVVPETCQRVQNGDTLRAQLLVWGD